MVMVDSDEFERIAAKMEKPFVVVLQKKRVKPLYLISCSGFLFFTVSNHVNLPDEAQVMRAQKVLIPLSVKLTSFYALFR